MPNIQVQFRRGTTTQHSSFTGAAGEVTVDTDLDTLRVHDGSTAGGVRLAKHSEIPTGGGGTVTSVDSGTGLTGGPITTSGTLSIAAGGVGTTQIADNGVTFAKMQDINTAKVIGRTTAGSGNPEEVSILDEDAMTSNSATALATQQSIKAYVDSQVGGVAASYTATPSSTDLQSTTEVDIFNETVSLSGTKSIQFKISYSAGGSTTNEWRLYVDGTEVDRSFLALTLGFSGIATLLAVSSSLSSSAVIRVTNKVNSGFVAKTLIGQAKLVII